MIRTIKCREWLDNEASPALFAEYAEECSLPELGDVCAQRDLYDRMEANGAMQSFGVYASGALVGFAAVLVYIVPHYGKTVGATESIFIAREHRKGKLGTELRKTIKEFAKSRGCVAFLWSAPVYSQFSALLARAKGCRHSNNVFIEAL